MKVWAWLTGALLMASGFLFDSDFVKNFSVPYPIIFLSLGAGVATLLILSASERRGRIAPVYFVMACFSGFLIVSSFASFNSGAGDMMALGMKVSTLSLNFLFFLSAYFLYPSAGLSEVSKRFVLLSIIGSVLVALFFLDRFNANWVAITLMFSVLLWLMSVNKDRSLLSLFSIFIGLALYSWFVFSARGVVVAAAFGATYAVIISLIRGAAARFLRVAVVFSLFLSSIFVAIMGVWLYNSSLYADLVSQSVALTGKSLDSSRLERWDVGSRLFMESPVWGWGVDAHISRVVGGGEYGDLHNLWWELLFRGGLLGALFFFIAFAYLASSIIKNRSGDVDVIAFGVMLILMSVYALGGVTHWPGAYMFWFVCGLLLRRSLENGVDAK
ncbi:O-antigen ligase family protein [Halothiobacillus sp.]|uniref:O-antigen ligase family protein n=1 Tax=Halothiobacillus sp. TaxID=1891311 RepID=UPI002AD3EAC1|nr:O-antigen ligase family protein [Halothiobacillus sp.]